MKMLRSALDNTAPFGYRKLAEQLLAQLTKASGSQPAAGAGDAKSPSTK
jgi:hypothetical protein